MKELGLYDLTPGTLRLREMLDFFEMLRQQGYPGHYACEKCCKTH